MMSSPAGGKRPRIAVTHDAGYNIDAYLQAVDRAGGEAVAVTPETAASMAEFDALVISGGVDVDPALYGQERAAQTEQPDPARDRLEQSMLQEALDTAKPVLAICRGLQLFNVAHGGSLRQHIENHRQPPGDKSRPSHAIAVETGSRLAELLQSDRTPVNSRHHQAVDTVGRGIAVVARAPDGTIEALERTDRPFAVAVQWHPENMAECDATQRGLFEGLIAAARAAAR